MINADSKRLSEIPIEAKINVTFNPDYYNSLSQNFLTILSTFLDNEFL